MVRGHFKPINLWRCSTNAAIVTSITYMKVIWESRWWIISTVKYSVYMYLTPPRDIESHQSHPTYSITVLHPSQMAILKDTFSGIGFGNVCLWVLINDHESFRKCIRERAYQSIRTSLGRSWEVIVGDRKSTNKGCWSPQSSKEIQGTHNILQGSKVSKDVELSRRAVE